MLTGPTSPDPDTCLMDSRKPLDGQAFGLMLIVCAALGLQQVALKATLHDISPVLQIALRSGIAAALVGALMLWKRELPRRGDGTLAPGLIAGALFGLEFLILGEALRHTSSSHAVVFLYTAPVFTALALHFLVPAERLAPVQWAGILLAFGGIAAAFLGHPGSGGDTSLLGDLLAVLAGVTWGGTTVVIRITRLAQAPAQQTLFYQLAVAFVILLVSAAALDQLSFTPTPLALASLAFQALMVSFTAFMIWFWLLRTYLASRLGVLSFMTPLFGVGLGAWLLNEPVDTGFLLGAGLVIAGITLVSGHQWLQTLLARRQATRTLAPDPVPDAIRENGTP